MRGDGMLRTVLVDDEPVILEKLKSILEENGKIEIAGTYTDPMEALKEMSSIMADCAFLDIEMPGLSGIELAERLACLNPDIEVIFLTAYNHYAAQAFDVNALDYMLKPIRPERLNKAIDKLIKKAAGRPESREAGCKIRSFGAFEVLVGGRPVKWSRSRAKELFAYLLQNEGKWISKYKLCEELWEGYGPERALAYLQICLHALRKNLREAGCTQMEIVYSDDRYVLKIKGVDWDLRRFESDFDVFRRTGSLEAAEQALGCCGGEYLEGEDWLWSDLLREEYIFRCNKLKKALKANQGSFQ